MSAYTWKNDEPCPRCGDIALRTGPEYGHDSYDSYSFETYLCSVCDLVTGIPFSGGGWYVDDNGWDPTTFPEYDPENPEHAWLAA